MGLLPQYSRIYATVLVAALGYFVDVFDIALFGIVRVESLRSLGFTDEEVTSHGMFLINMQMAGMLLGGVFWGIIGDKIGRVQVLFGSIFMYSGANLANAFVDSLGTYSVCRFAAGVGLAGEIGAGITLVSELLGKENRGWGTTIVASAGFCGLIAASLIGDLLPWRTAYVVGGLMGVVLLLLRVSVCESNLFNSVRNNKTVALGSIRLLLSSKKRAASYVACILAGSPLWYSFGIFVVFSPELAKSMHITGEVKAASASLLYAVGAAFGDIASGTLSQYFRNRRKVILAFLGGTALVSAIILSLRDVPPATFYALMLPLGFGMGFWAVFITTVAEQFGTNLRATVTTTVPNFVRGMAIPITLAFTTMIPSMGHTWAAAIVGGVVFTLAVISVLKMPETYGTSLDFHESQNPLELASTASVVSGL